MNSINCPVCSNLCSTQALSCPKCGHPFASPKASEKSLQEKSDFTCPKCSSDQTTTLKMAYLQGTSSGSSSSSAITNDGDLAFITGKVSHQSELAKIIAPPTKPRLEISMILIIGIVSFFVSTIISFILNSELVWVMLIVVFCGVLGYFYYASIQKKMPDYFENFDKWSKGRICLKCGKKWYVENKDQSTHQPLFSSIQLL